VERASERLFQCDARYGRSIAITIPWGRTLRGKAVGTMDALIIVLVILILLVVTGHLKL